MQLETKPEGLFSYLRVASRLARARHIAKDDAGFLVEHAAAEICSRIAVTNRTFSKVLDLFSPTTAMADALKTALPNAHITRLGDELGSNRDHLSVEPGSFDLVVSAFGLHCSNDLPGMLIQARLALKPDGLLMAALPAEGTLSQLREAMIAAETALTGGAALRVDPFVEIKQAGALLQRTGYALPVADGETLNLRYSGVRALINDLRSIGATTAMAGSRPKLARSFMTTLENEYAARFADDEKRIPATVRIVYLTGWSAHESQQKPLQPGSAKASLRDFLEYKGEF